MDPKKRDQFERTCYLPKHQFLRDNDMLVFKGGMVLKMFFLFDFEQ